MLVIFPLLKVNEIVLSEAIPISSQTEEYSWT